MEEAQKLGAQIVLGDRSQKVFFFFCANNYLKNT